MTGYIEEARRSFEEYKQLAEKAFAQLTPPDWTRTLDPESNSIAIIVKHLAGNMRSRWTDFLTSDGEKPDRNRDQEFELSPATTPEEIRRWWDSGWDCVFNALAGLSDADLDRKVVIRGQHYSVMHAINRQLLHYAQHIGQIVLLAKHYRGPQWQTLSVPRGKSATAAFELEAERHRRHNR